MLDQLCDSLANAGENERYAYVESEDALVLTTKRAVGGDARGDVVFDLQRRRFTPAEGAAAAASDKSS